MARAENIQLNVRSGYARDRVHALAKITGMTASQLVEDALRGYVPPGISANTGKLQRRGPLLVRPATGKLVTLEQANEAVQQNREQCVED